MESNRCSTDIFTRLHIAYSFLLEYIYLFTRIHTAYVLLHDSIQHIYSNLTFLHGKKFNIHPKKMDFGTKHNVHCHIKNSIISIWILTDFLIMDTHTHLQDTHALQWVPILHVWNKPSIFLLKNIFDILNFFIRGDKYLPINLWTHDRFDGF